MNGEYSQPRDKLMSSMVDYIKERDKLTTRFYTVVVILDLLIRSMFIYSLWNPPAVSMPDPHVNSTSWVIVCSFVAGATMALTLFLLYTVLRKRRFHVTTIAFVAYASIQTFGITLDLVHNHLYGCFIVYPAGFLEVGYMILVLKMLFVALAIWQAKLMYLRDKYKYITEHYDDDEEKVGGDNA